MPGIGMNGQIVLCPGYNDRDELIGRAERPRVGFYLKMASVCGARRACPKYREGWQARQI